MDSNGIDEITDIDELLEEVDQELNEEEREELKFNMKAQRGKTRKRFAWIKSRVQDVKCFFGSHFFIYGGRVGSHLLLSL